MSIAPTLEQNAPNAVQATLRRLKIVHIISSLKGGGMEHFVVRLADSQRRAGHDARVLALQGGVLAQVCAEKSVPVTVLGGSSKVLRTIRGAAYFAALRADIINAHNPTSIHYAVLAKKITRARVVMTDHAQTRGVSRAATPREAANIDAVAAVSEATLHSPSVEGGSALRTVIHNGIEPISPPRNRSIVRRELNLGNRPTAIMVAGMDPVKGHRYLLEAIAILRHRGVDLVTLIVGDGAERASIQANARALKLTDAHVRFLGYRTDAIDLMNASDVLVLPSLNEGLPICLLEAMAVGLPIVATSVGGTPELVHDREHGRLVPPENSFNLADAIAEILSDPKAMISYGRAGTKTVSTDFSFEGTRQKYDELYARLIN